MLYKNAFILKFDTRVKILFILIFTFLIFYVDKLLICVVLLSSILTLRIVLKIPVKNIKSFAVVSLLVVFSQVLFASGENNIIKPFFSFMLKWEGLFLGLMIICRLAALILLLPILTETSGPYEIARALAGFGINYRAAFIITAAFNLIPIFREEGHAIMEAQKLRGGGYIENGRFFTKLKAYPALVVPLVLGAMRKAQSASVSMDSRAFGAFKTRTWLEKPVMKAHDYLFLAVFLVFSALAIFVNYFLL